MCIFFLHKSQDFIQRFRSLLNKYRYEYMPRCVEFGLLLKIFIIKTAYHLCFSPFIDDGTLASGDASFIRDAVSKTFQLVIFWYFVSYKGLSR